MYVITSLLYHISNLTGLYIFVILNELGLL